MKKVSNCEIGDRVIYRKGYDIISSVIVSKPIDGKYRPKFLIGRVDLKNGDYLTKGTFVFDSMDEAKEYMRKCIKADIKACKEDAKYHKEYAKYNDDKVIKLISKVKEYI